MWRAVLVAVGYLALYLGAGWAIGGLAGDRADPGDLFATPRSLFLVLTAPLIVGAVVLAVFVGSLRWFRPLFARQQVAGRGWMWIAPAAVAFFVVLRLLGIPYSDYTFSVVVLTFATGLLVGFVEEVLTRGVAVRMLRDAGRSEWTVMAVSSLVFALLHATNILSGFSFRTVVATVGFAFGFGVCMYLTVRATRSLAAAVILHGLYDPTGFLATGGIDHVSDDAAPDTLLTVAQLANVVLILIGVVGLIAVRGRAGRPPGEPLRAPAG